jgi:hypothetical protein
MKVSATSTAVHGRAWYKRGVSSSGLGILAIGVGIGLVVGAGGMYLALEQPWRSAAPAVSEAPADAGPAVAEPTKGKKKKRRRSGGGGGGGVTEVPVDDTIVLTPADTKMSWRGDAVERPPATMDMTDPAGDEARALSNGEIQATISNDGGALERCVVDAVGSAPYSGEVTIKMLVDGDGRATKTRVHAPAFMHEAGLLSCARGAARQMGYPAVGGFTVVTIPFPISTR